MLWIGNKQELKKEKRRKKKEISNSQTPDASEKGGISEKFSKGS